METKNTKNVSIVSITPKTNTGIATRLQPGTGGFAVTYSGQPGFAYAGKGQD